jgi:iron complex transport system ATP-binding protein
VWSVVITIIVIIWSVRYKRALKQLSKPKFWILFVVITLLTAFVFTKAQPGENALIKGLMTGVQMNFRAILIIIGFSVLGAELYNPVIRNFFSRTSFRNLPLALELSAESLPLFIASIPDFKSLVRNPVSVFYQVIAHADRRLDEIKGKGVAKKKVFIITGPKAGGKTTFTERFIEQLKINKINIAGILSKRVIEGSETTGYDLMNIQTGNTLEFLRQAGAGQEGNIGRFMINESGLNDGREILNSLAQKESKLVIIDEVGLLELSNDGWAECINLLMKSQNHILMAVRDKFVEEVIKKWNLDEAIIINIEQIDSKEAANVIVKKVSR